MPEPTDALTISDAPIDTPAAEAPKPTEPAKPAEPKAPEPSANPWDDPKAAQAEIERLRRENGAARTNAKAQAAEDAKKELTESIAKALGLAKDDETPDPAKLTEQLTTAQQNAKQAALELAVFRSTADASVANALLDSRSFLEKVANIDSSDTAAIAAAVGDAVTANPALGKRLPAPNPGQGAGGNGPTSPSQLSKQDVERLSREGKYQEINKAREEGRLNDLLGIK